MPPSLAIRLSLTPGRVELECAPEYGQALQRIAGAYPTAHFHASSILDVGLDDLLSNLQPLTTWPPEAQQSVLWQPELLSIVEQNAAEAARAREILAGSQEMVVDASTVEAELGPGWKGDLTDFQLRDLLELLSVLHGANFSVPGAGKTRVGLAVFAFLRAQGVIQRAVVVAPKSAFEAWKEETADAFTSPPVVRFVDSGVLPAADILVVNYERLPDLRAALIARLTAVPSLLILDEAHRMKLGLQGAWGSACLAMAPYATRRLALTGTPAPNGSRDLENLMSFVWPGQGRAAVQQATQSGDLREASRLLKPLFVRTTKAELGLPPVDVSIIRLELPELHRQLYDALLGQFAGGRRDMSGELAALGRIVLYLLMAATSPALLAAGASRYEPLVNRIPAVDPPDGSSLAELMRDLPSFELAPKYKEVAAIVAANANAGRKTLVWSTFIRNLTTLDGFLRPYSPEVIHGGTADRDAHLTRFRSDPDCYVLLSNPATLGEGVSLHHDCHDAIYVDRDFAAGRFLQSLDRIHRLGLAQETETRISVLCTARTIDELVEQRLRTKLTFMGGVLDDPEVQQLGDLADDAGVGGGIDEEDVQSILGYLSGRDTT